MNEEMARWEKAADALPTEQIVLLWGWWTRYLFKRLGPASWMTKEAQKFYARHRR